MLNFRSPGRNDTKDMKTCPTENNTSLHTTSCVLQKSRLSCDSKIARTGSPHPRDYIRRLPDKPPERVDTYVD
jgi:hypothetical protein